MTRQLVDMMDEATFGVTMGTSIVNHLVASLLTDGPAEHTIVCPTCKGKGWKWGSCDCLGDLHEQDRCRQGSWKAVCPDCTNGRQTVIVTATVTR